MTEPFHVRRAAVLGAGVMGAQIAAHLVNAGVEAVLFELPAEGGDRSANARKAIQRLRKLQPAPLATPEHADLIRPANYDDDLGELADCDLVIEAVAERIDIKRDLFARLAGHLPEHAIIGSNTSGLSINALAEVLPETLRHRFCGIHFFNPPRYMHLVEMVPGQTTEAGVLDALETFLTTTLGKGVVRARDTPNFIGNRIGVFAIMAAIHHADRLEIPFDTVDALTGPAIGPPKSATFRTADVVGLDTLKHVVEGPAELLRDDPWVDYLKLPDWMSQLVEQGALGQKSGAGVYRKQGREIQVLDVARGDYRNAGQQADESLQTLLKERDPARKFSGLRESSHPQAQFLWAIHRDVFHYAAHLLGEIADNARDVDFAIRWGFGWKQGPFEIWQAAGWRETAEAIAADIQFGQAMSATPLPQWVTDVNAVHTPEGSWAPRDNAYRPPSDLPVYARQWFPETVVGGARPPAGETTFETEAVRLWHLEPDVGILSFRSRQHAVGADVLDGVIEAMDVAEGRYRALVLWQASEPFSVGANLKQVVEALEARDFDAVATMVEKFQIATGRVRDSRLPVVAGLRGMALGGGCEFVMHCDQVGAGLESYVGLVEAGVGLIPAGGGCKELALRAAAQAPDGDPFPFIRKYFEAVAKAEVGRSAHQARQLGLLGPNTRVILHGHEVLHVAMTQARGLAEAGYRPPLKRPIRVAGRNGSATLRGVLVNMLEGSFISEHDYAVASRAADALCGGDVETGMSVDEDWLLRIERQGFMELLRTEKTAERIVHTLKTGKPLRN